MKRLFIFVAGILFFASFLNFLLFAQNTYAVNGRQYTLVYPEDEESKEKIKKEITSTGIGDGNGGLESTYILVKNGILGTMQFNFDRDKSNSNDAFIYTKHIYCTLPKDAATSKCSSSAPSDNIYVEFDMIIGFDHDNGATFLDKSSFRGRAGARDGGKKTLRIPYVSEPFDLDAHREMKWKIHRKLTTNEDWKDGQYRGNDPYKIKKEEADRLIREKIMDNLVETSAYISVFQKLTDAQKAAWDQAAEAAGLTKPSEAPASTSGSSDSGDAGVNCQGGPMGWLFCPLINYMTDTLQISANLIDGLMQIKFLAQKGDSEQLQSAWRAFLSIANILLVIAFMVIVFSQATGAGLNNYNIKRMLPRLVVAAILMNVSFYIVAFLVDVSNIVGASVMGMFIGDGSISTSIESATGGSGGSGILGGALAGALLIGLLIFILTPVVLAIILVLVCLIARQLIIMCLIMVAPLAFVAWLLPNTEKYFKKWSDLLVQMLILYPIVMLIFGASLFFAKFLGEGGQNIAGSDDSSINAMLTQIIQLVVLCIPLVALPFLIKSSSSLMGTIGGYANKFGAMTAGKATDKISAGSKDFAKNRALGTEARMARMTDSKSRWGKAVGRAGSYRARSKFKSDMREKLRQANQDEAVTNFYNPSGPDTQPSEKRARSVAGMFNSKNAPLVQAQIAGRANELFGQKLKLEEAKLSGQTTSELADALKIALSSGDYAAAHAANNLMMQKGGPGVEDATKAIYGTAAGADPRSDAGKLASSLVRSNGKEFNASDPALTKWADQAPDKQLTLDQVATDGSTYSTASPEKMAGWSAETIKKADAYGGAQIKEQAIQLLQSKHADSLKPEARAMFEDIATRP